MKTSLLASLAMALCVPAAALAQTSQPVSDLPVTVGAEFKLAADGPGKMCRGTPAVAFGRDCFLVAWREGWEGRNGGARIRAVRVGLDGRPIGDSFELAGNPDKDAPQERPRIACAKDTFLVVWQDMRNGKDYDVLASRVSADGKLLDFEPIRIASGPHNQVLPDVAADSDGFLVVWQGYVPADRAFHDYAARVGIDGKVGQPNEVGLAPCLRVAFDGGHFLVACGSAGFWGVGDAVRLDRDGKPVDKAKPIAVAKRVGWYALCAAPGKGWLLVTHRSPPDNWGWGGPGAIRCYFVLADGKTDPAMPKETDSPGYGKLDANWLDCATRDRENWPYGPSAAAWDGRQFVVVWQRFHCVGEKRSMLANSDLMLMRTDGWKRQSHVPAAVAASEFEELEPGLACDGAGNLLCVYEKEISGKTVICARAIKSGQ